jgi:hypothetical protein
MAKKTVVNNIDNTQADIATQVSIAKEALRKLQDMGVRNMDTALQDLLNINKKPSKKSQQEIEREEIEALFEPKAWNKLSDKEKCLFFLRDYTSMCEFETRSFDSVMVKHFYSYMIMLSYDDLLYMEDPCSGTSPKVFDGVKKHITEYTSNYLRLCFLDVCNRLDIVVDPNHNEFKAYKPVMQKWLHKFVLNTGTAKAIVKK